MLQVGGGKVTDAKDIDKLRSALEKLVGTSGGRSLTRLGSLKRPVVGDPSVPADQKKALLYNLKGAGLFTARRPLAVNHECLLRWTERSKHDCGMPLMACSQQPVRPPT